MAKESEFSLGVTQLLDELLLKEEEKPPLEQANEDKLRQTFQKTQKLCAEAETYFKLLSQEEDEAKREADEKLRKAEKRLGLNDTLDSVTMNMAATGDSLYEALEANEAQLARVRQDIVDVMHKRGGQVPVADTPFARTVENPSLGATMDGMPPLLDFEKLLAECDAMQAELEQWEGLGLQKTPQGWRRLDPQELNQ
mmetsp:Transcript_78656/g.138721  ORF Transcript_78656/g.138721 Transcript_78656/m.138721 type:complete len:197 (-) Transcript_78656:109-699(-)